MTFREIAFQEDIKLDREKSLLASMLENQSPIMKVWFAVMLANLVLFFFVI